jgi:hypothetical protein
MRLRPRIAFCTQLRYILTKIISLEIPIREHGAELDAISILLAVYVADVCIYFSDAGGTDL